MGLATQQLAKTHLCPFLAVKNSISSYAKSFIAYMNAPGTRRVYGSDFGFPGD